MMTTSADIRVLHIVPSLSLIRGGTTTAVLSMAEALKLDKVESVFFCTDDDGPGQRLQEDSLERHCANRIYSRKLVDFYHFSADANNKLNRIVPSFDLIHVHGLFSHLCALGWQTAISNRKPLVISPHGMANRYGMSQKRIRKWFYFNTFARRYLNRAQAIHLSSEPEYRDFRSLGIRSNSIVVPLPVQCPGKPDPERFLRKWPELANRQLILFVGRLHPVKNVEAIIDCAATCTKIYPQFRFVIAGDGDERYVNYLKRTASNLQAPITFVGFLNGMDKWDAIAACSYFILPSHSESFGLAAAEALTLGKTMILGQNVALSEEMERNGFAIRADNNPASLRNALAVLTSRQPPSPATIIDYASHRFSPAAFASSMREIYNQSMAAYAGIL